MAEVVAHAALVLDWEGPAGRRISRLGEEHDHVGLAHESQAIRPERQGARLLESWPLFQSGQIHLFV